MTALSSAYTKAQQEHAAERILLAKRQLKRLDKRLGKNVGAVAERARLHAEIAAASEFLT